MITGAATEQSGASHLPTAPGGGPANPWDRYGWVMGAIWLLFLIFPLTSVVQSDHAVVWRVLGVVLILIFGATYVRGFIKFNACDTWQDVTRIGVVHLSTLGLLTVAMVPLLGVGALSMVPFIVAFGMFSLPLRWSLTLAAVGVLAPVSISLVTGLFPDFAYFSLIVMMVAVATGLVRVFEIGEEEHQRAEAELTLANERDRVARDVHDVLGHSLTVVTVKAELAQRLVDVDPERARAELAEIQSLSRAALAEIRATVAGLRVARLAEEVAAADAALTGAGIQAELPEDLGVVDPRHRVILAWVLREAVTNVVRHSGARTCTVELGPDTLRVTDDGEGRREHKEGNGLRGIRERVAAAGGTLSLGPGPETGTTLEVQL